ncbi:MAG: 30S ribosome-binding factor RbfA [Desulfobacterales bacterium]
MRPFKRAERVRGQIQKVLSEVLRKKVKDPRLTHTTITGVDLSQDLRSARIYYVTLPGDAHIREAEAGFASARGFVKGVLARHLGLRYMPEIRFIHDPSIDYGAHMEALINRVAQDHESDRTATESE